MKAGISPERWRQITGIFHAARRESPEARPAFLATACGTDSTLRHEVEEMLTADEAAGSFGNNPFTEALNTASDLQPALDAGAQVGPYTIIAVLGIGGMGEVYRAHDSRLGRDIAIKILPRAFAADSGRLMRFRREARLLAALNHPHIAAIYDIQTCGGVEHLVMELIDGDVLRGPLPLDIALEYARQVAEALAAAHSKGIVHRDVKPSNVKVNAEGSVKVLDFGLARDGSFVEAHDGSPAPRGDGLSDSAADGVAGSPAYMSPEQARGGHVDVRTDVWAFGCLLYELLAGRRAFEAESLADTLAAVQGRDPVWAALPDSTPASIRTLLERCLEKDPDRRLSSLTEAGAVIARAQRRSARRRVLGVAAAALLAVSVGGALVGQWRLARVQPTRDVARIMQLAAADDYAQAFALAADLDRAAPNDPMLATLWPRFSAPISLTTIPDGADVYVRPYAADGDRWQRLGQTPLERVRLPLGVFELRIEKRGYEPQRLSAPNPSTLLGNATNRLAAPVVIRLPPLGATPGMVAIPGGAFPVSLNAFSTTDPIALDPYTIDRYAVTNAQSQEFADAGGYARAEYWSAFPFELKGRSVSWRDAVAEFRDATGAPGPATWASGRYPEGTGREPVRGVSWYEAAAYCTFRGQTLPTVYHWRRAALSPDEMFAPLAPSIIRHSNLGTSGPAAVGTFTGVGPHGAYDMAGNVREWAWNEARPGSRWIQGGAWSEPAYMLVVPDRAPASDRSPINGFRCAQYGARPIPDRLRAPIVRSPPNNWAVRAVSDDVFEVFRRQLLPIAAPLHARIESVDATNDGWVKQKISFDTGYEDARTAMYLFLPKGAKPPYQAVVYFPGRSSFVGRMSSDALQPEFLDFVVRSGRALVWPVYRGSYERWIPTAAGSAEVRRLLFDWRQDLSRVIDVLSERPDIDDERIAFLGLSYGATAPMPLLALEERLRTAVLLSAGFTTLPGSPESDPQHYAARITLPVLLLSGREDFVFPLETSAKPLFARLGAPADAKRHVIFDAGHMMFPRGRMVEEVLGWLDRYLGIVGG